MSNISQTEYTMMLASAMFTLILFVESVIPLPAVQQITSVFWLAVLFVVGSTDFVSHRLDMRLRK